MSKSNVNPNHYTVAGRERRGEDMPQGRNKQKHAQNLVRQRAEIGAKARKPAPQEGKASPGTAPRPRGAAPQLSARQAAKRMRVNLQGADKRGKRSTAQKRASSRHEFDPMPATKAVAGAFGKEPSPRRRPKKK